LTKDARCSGAIEIIKVVNLLSDAQSKWQRFGLKIKEWQSLNAGNAIVEELEINHRMSFEGLHKRYS